ncbi:MAG: hypothetical protein ABL908_20730, partial [Hyphomicrobium sp.]
TWVTPEPDPNAAPDAPQPEPERVVDTTFQGYDLIGGKGDDTILVYKGAAEQVTWRKIEGGEGNDVIATNDRGPQYVRDAATGELVRSVIDAGTGDDVVFSLGNYSANGPVGGDVIGGEGRDLIFSMASRGHVYGDTVDGLGFDGRPLNLREPPPEDPSNDQLEQPETQYVDRGAEHSDSFWFWPGTFIMDAGREDHISYFGLPLTGGTNMPVYGVGSAANDNRPATTARVA